MYNAGLVLEGGGSRGIFTAGILDYFMEKNIKFEHVIGVSAGAIHATSYLSDQPGRSKSITIERANDKKYCSFSNLIKTGNLYETHYAYDRIPNEFYPFDYEVFKNSDMKLFCTVTNVEMGEAEYIELKDLRTHIDALRASASLPLMAQIVDFEGKKYLDGGMADSIPIKKSIADGYKKNVVILTQPKDYKKTANKTRLLMKLIYKDYPKLIGVMEKRHIMYNETTKYIDSLEKEGKIFVIRPNEKLAAARIEKDKSVLEKVYREGIETAKKTLPDMIKYLEN